MESKHYLETLAILRIYPIALLAIAWDGDSCEITCDIPKNGRRPMTHKQRALAATSSNNKYLFKTKKNYMRHRHLHLSWSLSLEYKSKRTVNDFRCYKGTSGVHFSKKYIKNRTNEMSKLFLIFAIVAFACYVNGIYRLDILLKFINRVIKYLLIIIALVDLS